MQLINANGKNYTVIKLLGKGKGGYSYLVTDSSKKYVLKQIHHEFCAYYQFGNKLQSEITAYNRLSQLGIPVPRLFDVDIEHERIVKEYIPGSTICDYVINDAMKEEYILQVKDMCKLLYPANINIDYFPTNFVVRDNKIFYIDYECNEYMDKWNFENWGITYWSKTEEFMKYLRDIEN